MSTAMSESAEKNMVTSLETKTQIIDEYIANAEHILAAFFMSGELREFVKDKDNQELKKVAQDYYTSFYSVVGNSIIGIADENQRNAMAIKDIVDKFTK